MPSTYVAHDVGWRRKYEPYDEYFGSNLSWYEISMKDISHYILNADCVLINTFIRAKIILSFLGFVQSYCFFITYFSSLPPIFIFIMWRCKKWRPVKISFVEFSFWNCRLYIRLCAFYGVVCMLLNEKRCIRPEQKKFYSSLSLLQKHTSVNEFQNFVQTPQ